MGWVQYPITEREGDQKDSLDMLQGVTPGSEEEEIREGRRKQSNEPGLARIPDPQVAPLKE